MFRKIHIRKHEVGLLFKRGDFVRPLGAGTYRLALWHRHRKIEVIDMLRTRFDHALLDVLIRDERMRDMLLIVDLTDKESVGAEVREALTVRAAAIGVTVRSVGLRDIVLPGDMKQLLNQVIAASKEAEANLIKRREETAAARSQANTAKLLAESPQLARLKELELLKDVLAGAKTSFVFGGGDIAEQVRGLIGKDDA